jgi:hypothetical protein
MRTTTYVTVSLLLGLLGAVAWFAYTTLAAADGATPPEEYAALFAGAGFAVIVGVGLMGLLFYSSREGYDEPARFRTDDDR